MRRLLPLCVLAASAACFQTRQPVPVEVDWTFGGQACTTPGVTSITIDVDGEIAHAQHLHLRRSQPGRRSGELHHRPLHHDRHGLRLGGQRHLPVHPDRPGPLGRAQRDQHRCRAHHRHGQPALEFRRQDLRGRRREHGPRQRRRAGDHRRSEPPGSACQGIAQGTTIGPLSPGVHSFSLAASGNSDDYEADVSATVATGQDTLTPVNLAVAAPTTASADVRWLFEPGRPQLRAVRRRSPLHRLRPAAERQRRHRRR